MRLLKVPPTSNPAQREYINDLNFVLLVCLVQAALMFCLTIYFVNSAQAAAAAYRSLAPLKDFVPIVRRLYAVLAQPDVSATFHRAFAIYVSYAAIQTVCVLILVVRLWPRIAFRSTESKHWLGFWLAGLLALVSNFFAFFGDYDMANSAGKYANRLASDSYFMSFVYCFQIPVATFFLCMILVDRFGRRAAEINEPTTEQVSR